MRIILINAKEQKIEVKDLEKKSDRDVADEVRRLLDGGYMETGYAFDSRNAIYVDADGAYRTPPYRYGFRLRGVAIDLFVGNGVILGHDARGDSVDTTIDAGYVEKMVQFLKVADA